VTSVTITERILATEVAATYQHLLDLEMEFLPNIEDTIQINDKVYKVKERLFEIGIGRYETQDNYQKITLYVAEI
jgi:hypothetical protein